jgi:hypothetical protein
MDQGCEGDHQRFRHVPQQRGDEEEYGEKIDEPERPERIDVAQEIALNRRRDAHVLHHSGRLDEHLNGKPQHIEVGEVDNLSVEVGAPGSIDPRREEKARNKEEVGHAERARPVDEGVQPGFRSDGLLDAER